MGDRPPIPGRGAAEVGNSLGPVSDESYRQHRFRRPPGACEIILVRHGESQAASPDVAFPEVDGQADPPLFDPDGFDQARLVGARLAAAGEAIAEVVVTPLQRTRQTAQPLLDALGVEPTVDAGLREVFLGDWDGLEFRRRAAAWDPLIQQMYREQRWDVLPGAEPHDEFVGRIESSIEAIAERNRDRVVVVFSHGGVIGQIMSMATGAERFGFVGTDNTGVTHLVVLPNEADGADARWGRWKIRTWNDTSHLSPRFTRDAESSGVW